MLDTDLAYIAGLIDGEGYIGVKRDTIRKDCYNRSYHARIQIRMVDEPAIRFISETLGGNYYQESPSVAHGRPLFCYSAMNLSAENILRSVLPFLRVKKQQALTVIEFRKHQSTANTHKTKVIGHRNFPNSHGTTRVIETKAYSDEYIAECDRYWLLCKSLNHVGV